MCDGAWRGCVWMMVHGEAVCVCDGAWRGCVCVMVHGEAVCG